MTKKKRILKHLTNVGMAALSFTLMASPATAIDPVEAAGQVAATEGGRIAAKEVLNAALKVARSKPSMFIATGITCAACAPVAGTCASASMCVACGILIGKTFG